MVEGAGLVTPGNGIISWGPSFQLCPIGGQNIPGPEATHSAILLQGKLHPL